MRTNGDKVAVVEFKGNSNLLSFSFVAQPVKDGSKYLVRVINSRGEQEETVDRQTLICYLGWHIVRMFYEYVCDETGNVDYTVHLADDVKEAVERFTGIKIEAPYDIDFSELPLAVLVPRDYIIEYLTRHLDDVLGIMAEYLPTTNSLQIYFNPFTYKISENLNDFKKDEPFFCVLDLRPLDMDAAGSEMTSDMSVERKLEILKMYDEEWIREIEQSIDEKLEDRGSRL